MRRRTRNQSAMEYLMTYGWAILIIAIVLAALFSLGVFGSGNLSAKAPPGSCRVFRPGGPGSTANLNLQGVCTGLQPQYVASFPQGAGAYIYGNFISSMINTGGLSSFTITAWVRDLGNNNLAPFAAGSGSYGCSTHLYEAGFTSYTTNTLAYHGCCNDFGPGGWPGATGLGTFMRNDGNWHFITMSWTPSTISFTEDGQVQSFGFSPTSPNLGGNTFYIGKDICDNWYTSGLEANVQFYNTALDSASIQALYQAGIGGAPVSLTNLVGWWPLNGDANDYSGNGGNGVATGIVYTSSWSSGYSH